MWLECCGHCSDFEIGKTRYSHAQEMGWNEFDDQSMSAHLGDVLEKGTTFKHTYDYGSTTECQLRVASEHELPLKQKEIIIEARNNPPQYPCSDCGKPSVMVCTECLWSGEGWLCGRCAKKHECGEDMLLPAANSPRAGVCGYMGEN